MTQISYTEYLQLRRGTAPPHAPTDDSVRVYADASGNLHLLEPDGTDTPIGGGGASGATVRIVLIAPDTPVVAGEDFASYNFVVGSDLDGLALTSISWFVAVASSSGVPSFAVRNGSTEMLSTNCTIDVGELTSDTATTPPVVNPTNAGVSVGDVIHFDCDADGTDTTGSEVRMTFA